MSASVLFFNQWWFIVDATWLSLLDLLLKIAMDFYHQYLSGCKNGSALI
jgi:hypothetical protein